MRVHGSLIHLAFKVSHDPVSGPLGNVRAEFNERGDVVLQVAYHDLGSTITGKGVFASEGVIIEATQSIHIGALVQRYALELLGGHEEDGAKDSVTVVDGL